MAIFSGPEIAETGLVLCLDAANPRSYPGSGTTWTDLSGSGNNGALTNGPTYSSSNKGSIVFDGSNDYVIVNSLANILSKTTYTKIAYIYPTSFTTSNNIISGGSGAQHAFWLAGGNTFNAGHNGVWNTVTSTTTLSLNQWYFGAVTYSSTSGWKLYVNGLEEASNASNTTFLNNQHIYIGSYDTANTFTGRIAYTLVYNRILTATEILNTYNATRSRFGL